MELVLIDIKEGHACVDSYSDRLKDSDEVAQALVETGNEWKIRWMSERIRQKYGMEYVDN